MGLQGKGAMDYSLLLELLGGMVAILHFSGILLAIHATLLTRTSQGAIAWGMSLVFFPYVAVPLYLVFGRQKFYGYVDARRAGDRKIDHVAREMTRAMAPWEMKLPERFHVLENLTMLPATRGNYRRLLIDGDATFRAMFAAIEQAKKYLLIQFFIVRCDQIGNEFKELLIRKAREGVKIRMLYDEIGSVRLPKRYKAELWAAGVEIRAFNTRRGWRNRLQINFRNHRKVLVADGEVAFIGGHNVGDEYMGRSERFGRWRDTHVELRGPCVEAVELSFLQDWHWTTRQLLELQGLGRLPVRRGEPGFEGATLMLPSGPADELATATLMLLAIISAARKRLWITSPYFVPDETVYDALQLAALRGVDVRIMLPAKPDHILVYLSSFSYLESAERVGVKFYRYQKGFLHQKVMLVDDDFSSVGTINLDNRSMRLNFELTAIFVDQAFARDVAAMLEQDFRDCERATPGDLKRRGILFRLAVRLARLAAPVQ
jgi:cardiolipin synthase